MQDRRKKSRDLLQIDREDQAVAPTGLPATAVIVGWVEDGPVLAVPSQGVLPGLELVEAGGGAGACDECECTDHESLYCQCTCHPDGYLVEASPRA